MRALLLFLPALDVTSWSTYNFTYRSRNAAAELPVRLPHDKWEWNDAMTSPFHAAFSQHKINYACNVHAYPFENTYVIHSSTVT